MKKTTKQTKIFQGCILVIILVALSSNTWAQATEIKGEKATNDSNHSIIYDGIAAASADTGLFKSFTALETNAASQVENDLKPELGEKLKQITHMLFQYVVVDESPAGNEQIASVDQDTSNVTVPSEEIGFGLALTSNYINNQLLDGRMQLEFHANPMGGGGAIFLKKTF